MSLRSSATVLFLICLCGLPAQSQLPPTPKRPVTDTYHGVAVVDDYRWLEDFRDPAVKQWAAAENQAARAYLDQIPERQAAYRQLMDWDSKTGPRYGSIIARGLIFAIKSDPRNQHPLLVALKSPGDVASERVLVDPDQIDPTHSTAIDFYMPSVDGRFVAVSLSHGGSENGDVHVYNAASGQATADVVPRVNGGTAGGSVAWAADNSGFFYTRYPRGAERAPADMDFFQQVWFHRLNTKTDEDTYALGKNFPRIAEIQLHSSRDGRNIGATVGIGDGGDFEQWILTPGQPWRQLAAISDEVKQIAFGFHDDVFLLSTQGAQRGKILHLSLAQFAANPKMAGATVLVPESGVVIEGILPARSGLCVLDMAGGPSQVRFLPAPQSKPVPIPIPAVSAIFGAALLDDGALLFNIGGYLTPPSWFRFDPARRQLSPTALRETSPFSTAGYEVVRDFAVSKDGTKIPLNIIRKIGIPLDGSHPAVLTGYGGFDISISPRFSMADFVLLDRGFVVAEANLRGGGEYGEQWHDQGRLTRKQNVFDDFAACAQYLIDRKYTEPARLGIIGGSNGGLLMGAELTQHPNLFGAVVAEVGIYDMLRLELSPNGAFNVTEYGTVKEADQFRALLAYSPYHHVKDGVPYPAVLFMTGDNDPRVEPMNSRKMTARLQASGTRRPVLLRTSSNAGHGFGTARNEAFAQIADADAFLIRELRAGAPGR